jgi:tRNA uridine 5-carboxymethylaminomethyl modification enzyme
MFTSRAEHRLLLREDNADLRLTELGRKMGLVDDARWNHFTKKREAIEQERERLDQLWLKPAQLGTEEIVEVFGPAPTSSGVSALELLRRPEGDYATLTRLGLGSANVDADVAEQVEIQTKYAGYIDRQQIEIERSRRYDDATLPTDLDYAAVVGLSNEVRAKLVAHRPQTVAQAGRIQGITPAAVSLLLVHLKKTGQLRKAS